MQSIACRDSIPCWATCQCTWGLVSSLRLDLCFSQSDMASISSGFNDRCQIHPNTTHQYIDWLIRIPVCDDRWRNSKVIAWITSYRIEPHFSSSSGWMTSRHPTAMCRAWSCLTLLEQNLESQAQEITWDHYMGWRIKQVKCLFSYPSHMNVGLIMESNWKLSFVLDILRIFKTTSAWQEDRRIRAAKVEGKREVMFASRH